MFLRAKQMPTCQRLAIRVRALSCVRSLWDYGRKLMLFHCARCKLSVTVLILYCLSSQAIDCQRNSAPKPSEEIPATAAAMPGADQKHPLFSFDQDGLLISNRDASSSVRIHGYLQADGRFFATNLEDLQQNVLLFRRIRPMVEGNFARRLSFRLMPDFGENQVVTQEVYAEWKFDRDITLQAGKFKTPIGLEILRSDRDLNFVERSLASDLVPVRDLGAQLEGSLSRNEFTYDVGFFSGTEDGANASFAWKGTKEGVVRAAFKPLADTHSNLARALSIGAAVSVGHAHNAPPSFNSIGQNTFFAYKPGVVAWGARRRVSPQAHYYYGPLGILAEYVISGERVQSVDSRRYLTHNAWEISGSYFLTGEKNQFAGVQPWREQQPCTGIRRWGAWELAVRHSEIHLDPGSFPAFASPASSARDSRESAVGLNWCINHHVRLQSAYEHSTFSAPQGNSSPLHTENMGTARLQLGL